jgi:DNA-binding response OmpR family regulator
MKILVVDDEEVLRKMIEAMLKMGHHTVVLAVDGQDGLEKFQEGGFSFVITDNTMPRMTGEAMVNEIRKVDSEVVFLMLSGDTQETINLSNINFFMSKPFDMFPLLELVNSIIDGIEKKQAGS